MGNEKITAEGKYKLLIAARNFHYDNFNKWLSYFYIAIGAIFVAYSGLVSQEMPKCTELIAKRNLLEYILLGLGFMVSFFWYISSKGYYYWNINFITLINHYEKTVLEFPENERVYFVFANQTRKKRIYLNPIKGSDISTSKVAILFAFVVTLLWGILGIFSFLNHHYHNCFYTNLTISIALSFGLICGLSLISRKILNSKMDHIPNLNVPMEKWESPHNGA